MKGTMQVAKIDKRESVYVGVPDFDEHYSENGNKKGWFQMVISPVEGELLYRDLPEGGGFVDGEAWIVVGSKSKREKELAKLVPSLKEASVVYIEDPSIGVD